MRIHPLHPGPRKEQGLITLIYVILLTIMMILVVAESRSLYHLDREVKFLEQQQVKRLNGPQTNTIATATSETK